MEFRKMFVLFAVILAVSGMAMAMRAADIDGTMTDLPRWTGVTSTASDITEGGNITEGNLNGTSLTDRWAGYYGNISSAAIYLTDNVTGISGGNWLYHWNVNDANQTGEVCVSTNNAYNFVGVQVGQGADIDIGWAFWSGADTGTGTFTTMDCNLTFEEQGVTVTNTGRAAHQGSSSFSTCILYGPPFMYNKGDFAFCTHINTTGKSYKNTNTEYELIVPTDDSTATATETYYFYIELI